MNKKPDDLSIPVIAEQVDLGKRRVVTGTVRVTKTAVPHEQLVEEDLTTERVDVRRVLVDRVVDGPLEARREGDTLIVPVMEESLEIRKVWKLKEEIHITRVAETRRHRENVTVAAEQAVIERLDAAGDVKPDERSLHEGHPAGGAAARRNTAELLDADDSVRPRASSILDKRRG